MTIRSIIVLFVQLMLLERLVTQDMRLMRMSIMNGSQFQCVNTTCLPYATNIVSNNRKCQMSCLSDVYCKAASFHQVLSRCQLFNNGGNSFNNMMAHVNTISMIVITGTRNPPGE